jgi:hypothetical protein
VLRWPIIIWGKQATALTHVRARAAFPGKDDGRGDLDEDIIVRIKTDAPVLRPDEPVPARPVLCVLMACQFPSMAPAQATFDPPCGGLGSPASWCLRPSSSPPAMHRLGAGEKTTSPMSAVGIIGMVDWAG